MSCKTFLLFVGDFYLGIWRLSLDRFFNSIRGELGTSWEGRYLALLLRELGRHSSSTFVSFFGISISRSMKSKNPLVCSTETHLKNGRRVDLSVSSGGDFELLIEIKEADGRKDNSAQLRDYFRYLRSYTDAKFVLLTRYPLSPPDLKEFLYHATGELKGRVMHKTYSELAAFLKLKLADPMARLVHEYLEDIGVTYVELDLRKYEKVIKLLAREGGAIGRGMGHLRDNESVQNIPELIRILSSNAMNLGNWIYEKNPKLFGRKFRMHFGITPWIDPEETQKLLSKPSKDQGADDAVALSDMQSALRGTTLVFWATGKTAKAPHQWLTIGYEIELDILKKKRLSKGARGRKKFDIEYSLVAYAGQWLKGGYKEVGDYSEFKKFPNENDAHQVIRVILKKLRASSKTQGMKFPFLMA